jgi:hypothetical protein
MGVIEEKYDPQFGSGYSSCGGFEVICKERYIIPLGASRPRSTGLRVLSVAEVTKSTLEKV